jgi:predicted amidohydrolase
MNVYLSRWVCLDVEANLRRVVEESEQAVGAGASLVVFPEVFLTGYARAVEPARVRATFAGISDANPGVVFAFGSFSEERRNRMTIWRGGGEVARYDKVHLFTPNDEPQIWEPGDKYAALRIDGWTVGLVTCNDIRFPEQARALRLSACCDALLAVAWWPWRRDHIWRTLLQARAIENGFWVIGCCVAASEHGEPVRTSDDHTYVLDPARAADLLVDPLETYRSIEEVRVFEASR